MSFPERVPQNVLHNLAGGGNRQLRPKLHATRALQRADLATAMFNDLLGLDLVPRFQYDDRVDRLSPFRVWNPDDCALAHAGMFVDRVFHILRIDVLAPGDDHVFETVDNEEVTVFIDPTRVAGMQPAVSDDSRGRFRIVPIAQHHRWSARDNLANHARRNFVIRRIEDAHLDSKSRTPGPAAFVRGAFAKMAMPR